MKKLISKIWFIKYHLKRGTFITPLSTKLLGRVTIGHDVIIHSRCLIECRKNASLTIGDGCEFNVDCRVTSAGSVLIGNNVLFGPGVYVSDATHRYDDIDVPVKRQGIISKGRIVIGDDCWFGKGSAVVGNPARVVKKYNFDSQKWEKVCD